MDKAIKERRRFIMIAGIAKVLLTTFLTEKVVISLMLKMAEYLAAKSSNSLDNEIVKILQDAYDKK
jgi:hypothetical protein